MIIETTDDTPRTTDIATIRAVVRDIHAMLDRAPIDDETKVRALLLAASQPLDRVARLHPELHMEMITLVLGLAEVVTINRRMDGLTKRMDAITGDAPDARDTY